MTISMILLFAIFGLAIVAVFQIYINSNTQKQIDLMYSRIEIQTKPIQTKAIQSIRKNQWEQLLTEVNLIQKIHELEERAEVLALLIEGLEARIEDEGEINE